MHEAMHQVNLSFPIRTVAEKSIDEKRPSASVLDTPLAPHDGHLRRSLCFPRSRRSVDQKIAMTTGVPYPDLPQQDHVFEVYRERPVSIGVWVLFPCI